MLKEEKAKRKEKPKDRSFIGGILLAMIPSVACILVCGFFGFMAFRHSSDIPLLDGLSKGEEAEAILLERLPLGSSRAEVQNFITEQLQPSEIGNCFLTDERDSICVEAFGRYAICSRTFWDISFYFESQELAEVEVWYFASCLH
jgi:hypothetical protein